MPFAELPPVNPDSRRTLASNRWSALRQERPDLGPAVALQQALHGEVLDLADRLEADRPPRLSLPPRYVTTKLRAGIPALAGERLPLPVEILSPVLVRLGQALANGGGGQATILIRDAVEGGALDAGGLLTLGFRREQGALRAVATHAGLGHDLLWLIVDLAVSPYAHLLLRTLFHGRPTDDPLRAALAEWSHGYCPLCGSWPTLAEGLPPDGDHPDSTHRLRCSFCACAWDAPTGACVYCDNATDSYRVLSPDPRHPGRVVELCGGCKGYAKTIPTDTSAPFPLVAIADLGSMDLDMAAMQAGFSRPALRQFNRR